MTGMTAEPDPAPESAPRFTVLTVAALRSVGYEVEADWEQETFELVAQGDDAVRVAGVIQHPSGSVALYAVWDEVVPSDIREAAAQWSVRANTDLSTCSIEFSVDSGILAVRTVVRVGKVTVGTPGEDIPEESLAISRAAFAAILAAAADDVAQTFTRLREPVAALMSGA